MKKLKIIRCVEHQTPWKLGLEYLNHMKPPNACGPGLEVRSVAVPVLSLH